jgi:hypothetical protein
MTITSSPQHPAAWRGHRPLVRPTESVVLVLALLALLLGALVAALLTGHRIDLESVPYLQLFRSVAGG